jgi:hypothetical protein
MSVKVTIDIFSGRPNPELTLSAKEAKDLFKQIAPTGAMRKMTAANVPQAPEHLGLRGIQINQLKSATTEFPESFFLSHETLFTGARAAAMKDTDTMERIFKLVAAKSKLLTNAGKVRDFMKIYKEEVGQSRAVRERVLAAAPIIGTPTGIQLLTCTCGPVYEPDWWNNNPQIKGNNNCYNYACNQRTDSFAQPGRGTNKMYTSLSGCTVAAGAISAKAGAISDALVDTPLANNKCPAKGHLVALVIWPGADFHWYRKGVNTLWSHKPGSTSVTNLDNSGAVITDPRTANRGSYTQFCTFMNVLPGHACIK